MHQITKYPGMVTFSAQLQRAKGKMRFRLTNDYMFRATFQKNKKALTGLVSALLAISPEEIQSIEVLNPIELGKYIEDKDFILDLKVLLNNNTTILIEMQVLNLGNWPERSLGYLCRSYDDLNKGQNYLEAKPVVQVSFLDFTLFKDSPDFFGTYKFMNTKNHKTYSDKLTLHVVDLTQIDKATEADKLQGIEYWARLFKATTWEEIKMLASNNSFMAEAAETVYQLSAQDRIRYQCEAREDFYNQQRYLQQWRERLEKENETLTQKNEQLLQSNALKDEELAAKDELIARLQAELSKQKDN